MSRDPASPPDLAFGPFRLERVAGRLLREGESVGLPPRLWAVLRHLVERPGHLVGKDELLDAVWGHRHVSESVLKSTMNSLRGKLGDDAAAPRYIETVPRRGYRFIAAVQASERDHTDAGSVAPPSIPHPPRPRRPSCRRIGISNGLWKARVSRGWAADACLDGLKLTPGPLPCPASARPDGPPRAR